MKDFWTKEFANYTDRFTQEATPAIQNKIGQFTSNPLIRNIIGQPRSSFDIRELMDNRKILLVNLSKGRVGDVNMRLLGSMITTRIFLAAMSRAELSNAELKRAPNFYFYVDEFQNFANETFSDILSEARKYNLNLVIAHQYIEQMEEEVAAAVFGNVGTTIAFRVGPFDAEKMEPVFAPEFTQEDLVNLGFAQVYLTLMIDGIGSRPFSAQTLPPIEPPQANYRDQVIEASRTAYGHPRTEVESAVYEDLASTANEQPAEPKPRRFPQGSEARVPRPQERERRYPAPRAPAPDLAPREERPMPPSSGKSAGELKAILRSMAEKTDAERGQKEKSNKQSLKGALADVIARNAGVGSAPSQSKPEREPTSFESPRREAPPRPRDIPTRPAAPITDPRRELPRGESRAEKKPPFEVPEDELRRVLKGET